MKWCGGLLWIQPYYLHAAAAAADLAGEGAAYSHDDQHQSNNYHPNNLILR